MCKWLPQNEIEGFPPYAHTMIGVGALVVNSNNEILVVCEKHSLIPNSWKLPGGYVEPFEDFVDAAIREVEEETNIKTKFDSVLSIRHAHGANFGCSDLYFVISLIPQTNDIKKCDREIERSQWMKLDEYLSHPNVHETNRSFLRTYLTYKEKKLKIECHHDTHPLLKKKYCLYNVVGTTDEKNDVNTIDNISGVSTDKSSHL